MMKLKVLTDPETGVKTLDPNDPAAAMALAMLGGRGSISDLLNAKVEEPTTAIGDDFRPEDCVNPDAFNRAGVDDEDLFIRETALKIAAETHYNRSHMDILAAASAYYYFLTGNEDALQAKAQMTTRPASIHDILVGSQQQGGCQKSPDEQ
jgi:hypothetical protein